MMSIRKTASLMIIAKIDKPKTLYTYREYTKSRLTFRRRDGDELT